jgi:hypothetical protein
LEAGVKVAFVFTNPGHHLEMMAPVAAELERRGVRCELISLAELRGFDTARDDARLRRAIPLNLRKQGREPQREASASTDAPWSRGELAKFLVWQVLRIRLWQMLRGAGVVVIPNDMVYPYVQLIRDLHRRGVPTVLMQEGIRFALPSGYSERYYGGGGTAAICAWGEGSRDYFVDHHVPEHAIAVTGSPRVDDLDYTTWRERGRRLVAARGLTAQPIAFLSNPIEIAGYGTKQAKLELFARFLAEAAPVVRERRIPIVVKTHLHEDPAGFARVAAASPVAELVTVIEGEPIFAVIAAARAAVVMTSTVGLEALMFGVPLAQLEIPGHELAFEYVRRDAAVLLRIGAIGAGIAALLEDSPARRVTAAAFVDRHLHDRGRARHNVADVIERVLAT